MDNSSLLIYTACIIAIFLIGRVFLVPLKYILKLAINSFLGGVLICIINFVGAEFNLHIGLNIFTAIFVGLLGIPGSIFLIIFSLIFN